MRPVSGVSFIYAVHLGHSTLADHGWRPNPYGVGELPSTFLSIDGGCSRIYSSDTSQGLAVDVCYIDGGRFRISVSTSQRGPPSMFFTLMVGAPGSPLAPRWPIVDVL
jgi:hypothetical protein